MTDDKVPVIAIDGPAGAGKSTVSCALARRLNYGILVSGALYRLVALLALRREVTAERCSELADVLADLTVRFLIVDDAVRVTLDGEDVTEDLHDEQCAKRASDVSRSPELRDNLLEFQRSFRAAPGLVADGRDMGTVVFPDAKLKIFLTASLEERARRRYEQLRAAGVRATLVHLVRQLSERDRRDQERDVAPLKPATDAIIIDTTEREAGLVINDIMARLSV